MTTPPQDDAGTAEAAADPERVAPVEPPAAGDPRHAKGSDLVLDVLRRSDTAEVSVSELLQGLGDRAFGMALLLFALPNCIPSPFGPIFGPPLVFFGVQMVLGRRAPWLPQSIARRRIGRASAIATVERGRPYLRWVERLCRPRLEAVTAPLGERLIGALVVVLAALIAIPFPFSNFVPAVAIIVLAIGLIEEDGVAVLLGAVTGLAAIALVVSAAVALGVTAAYILPDILSL